jgi:hypothetical protein
LAGDENDDELEKNWLDPEIESKREREREMKGRK